MLAYFTPRQWQRQEIGLGGGGLNEEAIGHAKKLKV